MTSGAATRHAAAMVRYLGAGAMACLLVLGAAVAEAECEASGRRTYTEALEALGGGDLSTSARLLLALLDAQPDCAEARNNLAVVFVEQGRFEDAAEQLRAALRVRPDYQLARRNLERLDAILLARARPTPQSSEADAPPPVAAASQTAEVSAAPPATPAVIGRLDEGTAMKRPPSQDVTPAAGTLDERSATVGVIEPSHNRICVQQRNAQGAVAESCFPIEVAEVHSWPRWLVATELTPQRIRLRDETGQVRLEIVRDGVSVTGDVVQLRQVDFDAFSTKIVPWRTAWVILQ
jgi:hypothetical protein